MQFDIPYHWVIFRADLDGQILRIAYNDDRRRRSRPTTPAPPILDADPSLARRFKTIILPYNLPELMGSQLAELPPEWAGPNAGKPSPLPVFVDPSPAVAALSWEAVVEAVNSIWGLDAARYQVVRLSRKTWAKRKPLQLPLQIGTLGQEAEDAVDAFRGDSLRWGADAIDFRSWPSSDGPLRGILGSHIVVADRRGLPRLITALRTASSFGTVTARTRPVLPRLLVLLQPSGDRSIVELDSLPTTIPVLIVEQSDQSQQFITEFLYGVVHDYPLHAATKAGLNAVPVSLQRSARLYADPASNQGLSVSDALVTLLRQAREFETAELPGNIFNFLDRLGTSVSSGVTEDLRYAAGMGDAISAGASDVLELRTDFRHEGLGLVPLARATAAMNHLRLQSDTLRRVIRVASTDEGVRATLANYQQRRVDVALERNEHSPLLGPGVAAHTALWVDRQTVLRANATYRLVVGIGRRFRKSLIEGKAPPIDLLLPGGSHHDLTVAVFGLDFKVLGPTTKSLRLPELGASAPIGFQVKAPDVPMRARLRIGIYHEDHLVQSFLLDALVEVEERRSEHESLRVNLEFSRTARYANLDQLQPRAISLGVNQAPGATHTLMVKHQNKAQDISVQWQAVESTLKDFRSVLARATYDADGQPRYPTNVPVDAPGRATFDISIRELASLGKALYDGLWVRARGLQGTLRELTKSSNQTIQVVRLDPNNVVPWSVIYDYPLPAPKLGDPPLPVCLGWNDGAQAQPAPEKACSHGPNNPGYCIYGFWGVRHVLEELLMQGTATDAVDPCFEVTRPSDAGSLCLSVDAADQFTTALQTRLKATFGVNALRVLGTGDDLMELLWSQHERPKVLFVLGHLQTSSVIGEPIGPRIVLPGGRWLQASAITQRTQRDGRWDDEPHVLTLLMACGSAQTTAETLNDYVTALNDAGASAVVGTEALVFSGFVARIAGEVAAKMSAPHGVSLGAAILAIRRQLLTESNPLGFAFTYYGSADLRIAL